MHLGLDVGTGMTKLTRYHGDARLTSVIVPTAVLYRGLASRIPDVSAGGETPPDAVRCDGFPAMLGVTSFDRIGAWGGRTPAEVTQSFLRRLLNRADGEEGDLVITVPPAGAPGGRTLDGRAVAGGTELVEILGALGHPPQRVLPAPIAALTYLRRKHRALADATRFAICDIGAGGMSLALCTATAGGAQLADVVRMTGAAAWSDGIAPAGRPVPGRRPATGARPVTLAECLVAEMARIGGAPAAGPGDGRAVHRWRALEAVLTGAGEEGSPGHGLRRVFGAGGRDPVFGVLRFADVQVTVTQVLEACSPLADSAGAALTGLLVRQADPGWHRFGPGAATRIVLTGGLAGLGPIRAALLRAAGLDPRDPGDAVVEAGPGPVVRLYAPAFGAALVAAGQADPTVRYPYAVRLSVHRAVRDRIEASYLELAAADTVAPDQAETPIRSADGEPVVVTVPASPGPVPLTAALPAQLVPGGGAAPVPAEFRPAPSPPAGDYRISVSGDPAGMAIVLHSLKEDRKLRYVLRPPGSAGAAGSAGSAGETG
jgi:hypothetical protein